MRALLVATILALPVVGSACASAGAPADTVTNPSAALDQQFTLTPGQQAAVSGTGVEVRFDRVEGDMRCPPGVSCVLGGSADVRITVIEGSAESGYVFHTGDQKPVRHKDLSIDLVELAPFPFSSVIGEPEPYRATLRVTR
jgi:hypothetical protein